MKPHSLTTLSVAYLLATCLPAQAGKTVTESGMRQALTRHMQASGWWKPGRSIGNLAVVRDRPRFADVLFEIRDAGKVSDLDTFVIDKSTGQAGRNGDGDKLAMAPAQEIATRTYGARAQVIATGVSADGQHVLGEVWGVPGIETRYEIAVKAGRKGGFAVASTIARTIPLPAPMPTVPSAAAHKLSVEARDSLRALFKGLK